MSTVAESHLEVPYFRPTITEDEVAAVIKCLRSGWLTTGPRAKEFEERFASHVRAKHAIAVNSCTAALHLALQALGLGPGKAVLVPTLTFAATAAVVRHQGAIPILVDCDRDTLHMDLADAAAKLKRLYAGQLRIRDVQPVGIIPVHIGGLMMDMIRVREFAEENALWVVEDAAHAFPSAMRAHRADRWQFCGQNTSAATCFSFYTNKTITTGEGGMITTGDEQLAERMRQISFHGLSQDPWSRANNLNPWDYDIQAPGYKYNLTDLAASLGTLQLSRAESMRTQRESIAMFYREELASLEELELPALHPNRVHAWHLFPIRLCLERLTIDRNEFVQLMRERGVTCSVHWRPLHLHSYYQHTFGWTEADLPIATEEWQRLVSLPLYPGMRRMECNHVVRTVRELCLDNSCV